MWCFQNILRPRDGPWHLRGREGASRSASSQVDLSASASRSPGCERSGPWGGKGLSLVGGGGGPGGQLGSPWLNQSPESPGLFFLGAGPAPPAPSPPSEPLLTRAAAPLHAPASLCPIPQFFWPPQAPQLL